MQREWCEVSEDRDFFDYTGRVDWCVTNPPWSKYRDFARHAYEIADNVAFLVLLTHDLALIARWRDMQEAGFGIVRVADISPIPARPWSVGGFRVGVVWKQRGYTGPTEWTTIRWTPDNAAPPPSPPHVIHPDEFI